MRKMTFILPFLISIILCLFLLTGCGGGGASAGNGGTPPGSDKWNTTCSDVENALQDEPDAQWTASETYVTQNYSEEESKVLCGLLKKLRYEKGVKVWRNKKLTIPDKFTWSANKGQNWLTPVKNQGPYGTCVAFAGVGALEMAEKIAMEDSLMKADFSEWHLWNVGTNNQSPNPGGWNLSGLSTALLGKGCCDENECPYTDIPDYNAPSSNAKKHKATSFEYVSGRDNIKQALMSGPVVTGMEVYADFCYYNSGVYRHVTGQFLGYHAIIIYGWDDSQQAWLCKNSWSNNWGEDGLFRIGYNQVWNSGYVYLVQNPAPVIKTMDISPLNESAPKGVTVEFRASGKYDDGTTGDITGGCEWTSSNPSVVRMDGNRAKAVSEGTATITASYEGITKSTTMTVTGAEMTELQMMPAEGVIPAGLSALIKATALFTDGSTIDVTGEAQWASSDADIAVVDNGQVDARSPGEVVITASYNGFESASNLSVVNAEATLIEINPPTHSMPLGMDRQFTATATFTDGETRDITSQCEWYSDNESVAVVSDTGYCASTGTGQTYINARIQNTTLPAAEGSARIDVTSPIITGIEVTPVNPAKPLGLDCRFASTAIYSDGSTYDITGFTEWTSSNEDVAVIDNVTDKGLAQTESIGQTTINASYDEFSDQTVLTVTDSEPESLYITPNPANAPAGYDVQLRAFAVFTDGTEQEVTGDVQWVSEDSNIVTVSNVSESKGLAMARNPGTATVTANWQSFGLSVGVQFETLAGVLETIKISPENPSAPLGTVVSFTAAGTYSGGTSADITSQVLWETLDTNVALISNAAGESGKAATLETGFTEVKASVGNISDSTVLTVTEAELVSITVLPGQAYILDGSGTQFTAQGKYTDGATVDLTSKVLWTSSNPATASISNAAESEGLATGLEPGTTQIRASYEGIVSSPAILNVLPMPENFVITPYSKLLEPGETVQFTAIVEFNDGSSRDVTTEVSWNSSLPAIASITGGGLCEGLTVGETQVTASYNYSGLPFVSNPAIVTVDRLESIQIDADPKIVYGWKYPFKALGVYESGATADLSDQVQWISGNTSVITIDANGTGTTVAEGNANISATLGSLTSNIKSVQVVAGYELTALLVQPLNPRISAGTILQLQLKGYFADPSNPTSLPINQRLHCDQFDWTSSDETTASVNQSGLVTGNSSGSSRVTAARQGSSKNGYTDITVTN
jgi:C1A family cysteine protease